MGRRTKHALVALAVVLAACGGGGDVATPTTAAAPDNTGGTDQGSPTPTDAPTTETPTTVAAAPDDQPTSGDPSGSIDGSDTDWATVDLTTIDWVNIDMRTIDFQAISANPTAADLDEATSALIASRIFPGSATLTIGDEVWEFDNFVCAFGHENTQSDVFSFSSNSFGEHSDGTRVQMQADIWDRSGQGRYEGDDLTHETYINDIEDFDNPVVDWNMSAPSGVTLNGDFVSVAGDFDNALTDEVEAVPGTLEAECGTTSRR